VPPVPDKATVVGELEALLTNETLPVTLPVVVGANETLKVLLFPVVKVRGTTSPVMLKPVPVRLSPDTTTLVLPVLLRVTDCVLVVPVGTLPKATLLGVAVSCDGTGTVTDASLE